MIFLLVSIAPIVGAAMIGGGAGILSSIIGSKSSSSSQSKALKFQKDQLAEAKRQYDKDYEYRKAIDERNYAYALNQHSHTVEDMKRAGLNPLLAAGATNAVPIGAASGAHGVSGGQAPYETMGSVAANARLPIEAAMQIAQVKLMESQSNNIDANTASTVQQTEFFGRIQYLKEAEIEQALTSGAVSILQAKTHIEKLHAEIGKIGYDVRLEHEKWDKQAQLLKLQIAVAAHDLRLIERNPHVHSSSYHNMAGSIIGTAVDSGRGVIESAGKIVEKFNKFNLDNIKIEVPKSLRELYDSALKIYKEEGHKGRSESTKWR